MLIGYRKRVYSGCQATNVGRCGSVTPQVSVVATSTFSGYGNFTIAESPKGRLQESDFALCRTDVAIKSRVLYEGAEQSGGKRYRQER